MVMSSVGTFSCLLALISAALGDAGEPYPLRMEQQALLLTKHNELRRDTDQINMQCLLNVSEGLIQYAQKIAEKCEKTLPNNEAYGLAMKVSNKPNQTMINDYISAAKRGKDNYNHTTNKCGKGDKEACTIFRQVYWYEAYAIGCGRANCGNATHLVCAYSYKHREASNPFISWRTDYGACRMCSSEKPICDEEYNCCTVREGEPIVEPPKPSESSSDENPPTPAPTPAPTSPTPSPEPEGPISEGRPGNLVPLELWWDEQEQKYYLVTNTQTINSMKQNKKRYVHIKVLGKVASAPTNQCGYLNPIRGLHKSGAGKIQFVINDNRYAELKQQGYQDIDTVGYAIEHNGICGADYSIIEYEHPGTGFFIQTDSSDIYEKKLLSRGYKKNGASFYIWKA